MKKLSTLSDFVFAWFKFLWGKTDLILGQTYNGAAYGTEFNSKRKVTKTDDLVYNNRILFVVKYNF